jgi:hypothetical protein
LGVGSSVGFHRENTRISRSPILSQRCLGCPVVMPSRRCWPGPVFVSSEILTQQPNVARETGNLPVSHTIRPTVNSCNGDPRMTLRKTVAPRGQRHRCSGPLYVSREILTQQPNVAREPGKYLVSCTIRPTGQRCTDVPIKSPSENRRPRNVCWSCSRGESLLLRG